MRKREGKRERFGKVNRILVNDKAKEERRIQQKVYQELLAQMEKERRERAKDRKQAARGDEEKNLHMANANDPSDMIKEKENREYVQKSRNQSQNAAMGKKTSYGQCK